MTSRFESHTILVCDPIPRILEIEMPVMGPCSRSAKWACHRPGGGFHTPLLECRTLYLHTGLVRTNIGSLLEPPVSALKEGCVAAAVQTDPCPFCWARTGTHTGYFNFKNPWNGITHQDSWYGIKNVHRNLFYIYSNLKPTLGPGCLLECNSTSPWQVCTIMQ